MAGATPVPESRTEAPPASLLIETVSPTAPTPSGAKVTSKVAEPEGGMTAGSAGRLKAKPKAPPRLMELTVRSAEPVFEMVAVCAPLVHPTGTFPKESEGGATLMAGPAAACTSMLKEAVRCKLLRLPTIWIVNDPGGTGRPADNSSKVEVPAGRVELAKLAETPGGRPVTLSCRC